jgi:hypothetical protein
MLAILWVPLSFGPTLWNTDQDAREFLLAMWQVEAAAFGLVIAGALFLYEAYAGTIRSKYGIRLRAYAQEAGIVSLVTLLTTALIVTGATALGLGNGAPGGWAAAVTLALAAWTLLRIPSLFTALGRMIEPAGGEKLRREFLKKQIADAVRDDVLRDLMLTRLTPQVAARRGQVSSYAPGDNAHPNYTAGRTGVIDDIDMGLLTSALASLPKSASNIIVVVQLGQRVRTGAGVVYSSSDSVMGNAQFLHIDESLAESQEQYEFLATLYEDGIAQIRSRDTIAYARTLRLYEFTFRQLLDLEKELIRIALGGLVQHSRVLEELRLNVYRQFLRARDDGEFEACRTTSELAVAMATEALRQGHLNIATSFLNLVSLLAIAEVQGT